MDGYKITPLRLGSIVRKKSSMIYGAEDTPLEFPLVAFLLEGFGRRLLVDTGGSPPDGVHWQPYTRPSDEALPQALARAGAAPEDIDGVIFTHLHWDHAGGSSCLTRARFYAQLAEYMWIAEKERPGYERDLVLGQAYELLDGDVEQLLPGVSVLLTPGHSVGSQCVRVETPAGGVVIAGDLIPTYENLDRNTPNGGNYDLAVIRGSMARVQGLGLPILPGHDGRVFSAAARLSCQTAAPWAARP